MKEVYPGTFLIKEKRTFGAIKPPENIYVLAGSDGIIFDAGYGTKKTVTHLITELKKVEELYKVQNKEFKLAQIIVSHCHSDYFSGLKRIRKALGIKVSLTKKNAEFIKDKKTICYLFKIFYLRFYLSECLDY